MTQYASTYRDFMSPSSPADGKACAGTPLAEDAPTADREAIIEALKTVHDPEIPVNIYDLGLIYEMELDSGGKVRIGMTLTAPACPVAGEMPQWVADAVAAVEGVGEVEVAMVWDPPWSPELMSDDAKLLLDFG